MLLQLAELITACYAKTPKIVHSKTNNYNEKELKGLWFLRATAYML